jgi:hypothetical protein
MSTRDSQGLETCDWITNGHKRADLDLNDRPFEAMTDLYQELGGWFFFMKKQTRPSSKFEKSDSRFKKVIHIGTANISI